jgi:hypothetical protein
MGRGDRKSVRWAHDRERKLKQRQAAQAAARASEKKKTTAKK